MVPDYSVNHVPGLSPARLNNAANARHRLERCA